MIKTSNRIIAVTLLSFSLLVLVGRGNKVPALLSVSGQPIEFWLAALRERGQDVNQRIKAVRALSNVGNAHEAAIPAISNALEDPNVEVRAEAVLALLKSGPNSKAAIPKLQQLNQSDPEAKVRGYAEKAIAKINEG